MGSPIEITVTVDTDETTRRFVEKKIRGLLQLREYDAYVDTVNLPEDEIEVTIEVQSPQDAQNIKNRILEVSGVESVS